MSTALFRIVAVLVLFLSITTGGLQVLAALNANDHADPNSTLPLLPLLIPPILSLIAGVGLSTLLEGVARILSSQRFDDLEETAPQARLRLALSDLKHTLPGLIAAAVEQATPNAVSTQEPVEPASPPPPVVEEQLQRLIKLMEEMKELSMLDENQRQTRRAQNQLRRKNARLEEAGALIQQSNWAQADALLTLLESLHPGDVDVLALRNQLDDARLVNQTDDFERVNQQVTDLLGLSEYAQATAVVDGFLEQYPSHLLCQQLSQQIRNEEQIYLQSLSDREYDQIKASVEARQWRVALEGVQKFLQAYPDNSKVDKIRKQLRVIQKNAEIEERHEQEDRIKDLINTRQFDEAADLSQNLLARFPDSPQAAYLTDLIPRLRERASAEAEGVIT